MKPPRFEYVAVDSPEEAVAALVRFQGDARLLAGGQSLVPLLNMRLLRPAGVIDINRISGLDGLMANGGRCCIGALTRYSTFETSSFVHERLPLLAPAVPFVGDRQIRNRGTLGGALCHADPAGEMALCAVTLGATVRAVGPGGAREIPADEFFKGAYATALEPVEMLVEVSFPDGSATVAAFAEHARRHGDFAVVSVATAGLPGPDGSWQWVRIGLGAVADRPIYARRASALLAGARLEPEVVREVAETCRQEADPPSDVRASAEYRRHLIGILVERALGELREQHPAGSP